MSYGVIDLVFAGTEGEARDFPGLRFLLITCQELSHELAGQLKNTMVHILQKQTVDKKMTELKHSFEVKEHQLDDKF